MGMTIILKKLQWLRIYKNDFLKVLKTYLHTERE